LTTPDHIRRIFRVWSGAPRAVGLIWKAGGTAAAAQVLLSLISGLLPLAGLWATKLIVDSVVAGDGDRAYLMVGAFAACAGLSAAAGRISSGIGACLEARIPAFTNALLAPVIVLAAAVPRGALHSLFMSTEWSVVRLGAPEARQMQYFSEIVTSDQHAKEVRLFDLGDTFVDLYRRAFSVLYGALQRVRWQRAGWNVATAFCAAAGAGAVYAYIAVGAAMGAVTVGDLVLYTGLLFGLHTTLWMFANCVRNGYGDLLDLSLFFDFLDLSPRLSILPEERRRRVSRPLSTGIVLEKVSFAYPGTDHLVLDKVDLEIEAGRTVALVGTNGAGKTTLVKLLTRLYDPTGGRILLGGVDLREYDIDDLRQAFGVVLQDFVRYHLTVRENIGFGQIDAAADEARLLQAAERGQAAEVIARLPRGMDTLLGREFPEGMELSGGEWQKIAIARGFMRNAEILVLDEPTAALDARSEQALYERFAELVTGRTALFISHRLATVRLVDRIAVLDGGRVAESGDHDELMTLRGQYARLFALQAERYHS